MDYNLFHTVGEKWWLWADTTYTALAEFQLGSGQDQNSIEADPLFVDTNSGNFHLNENSPAKDAGGPLTVTSGSGSGTHIPVSDVRYFSDGLGLQAGDRIRVGDNLSVRIVAVDYVNSLLTVDTSIFWENAAPVNYHYAGGGPDIGAFEEYTMDHAIYLPLTTRAYSPLLLPHAPPICGQEILLIVISIVGALVMGTLALE
jgi:hypothetical protein